MNKEWMAYFNEYRDLWTPVAIEWARLEKEYLSAKTSKQNG